MCLVNFTVFNKRGEQALSLTRSAHGRDHDMVREIPAAEFNLQNITGPDELKQTIDNVSEIWKDAGRKAGRDKMTWAETQALAEQMGLRETVDRLLRRKAGDAMNAEEITASLQAIATSGMELNRLAKIASNSTDAEDLLRFRQHMAFQSALQTNMKYDAFVKFAANPPDLIVKGKTYPQESFYSALKGLVESPSFTELSIPDKQTLIKGLDSTYKSIAKTFLLDSPAIHARRRAAAGGKDAVITPDSLMNLASIAEAYWSLAQQSRDAWTFELDIRPFVEPW